MHDDQSRCQIDSFPPRYDPGFGIGRIACLILVSVVVGYIWLFT